MHTNSFNKRFVIQERTLQSQSEKRCCIPLVQGVRRCGSSMILVSSHLSEPSLECADPVTEETRESNETIQTPVVGVGVVWIPFRPPIIDCLVCSFPPFTYLGGSLTKPPNRNSKDAQQNVTGNTPARSPHLSTCCNNISQPWEEWRVTRRSRRSTRIPRRTGGEA